jgi:ferredoxin
MIPPAAETVPGTSAVSCTVSCTVWPGPGLGPVSFPVASGSPVLHAMVRRALRVLPVGCRGGGCGVCRVRVVEGAYRTLRMSRRHVSEADEGQRLALACRLLPSTDLVVEAAPCQTAPTGTTPSAQPFTPTTST